MDFSTAIRIVGGFTLGGLVLLLGLVLFAVARTVQIRRGSRSVLKGAVKPISAIFIIGALVGLISLIFMFATGSSEEVGTLLSVMKSKDRAIYNNAMYVRTDLTFNGTSDYKLDKATAYSGEGDIKTVKDYSDFDILVAMNSNITGTLFVREDEEKSFIAFYTNYGRNFKITATLDSREGKPSDISQKADAELFSALKDENNLKEADSSTVPYINDVAEEKSVILSATSLDGLVTEQVRIYPPDDNGQYIKLLADGDDMLCYEIDKKYTDKLKTLF